MRVERQRQAAPTTTSAIELLRMDLGLLVERPARLGPMRPILGRRVVAHSVEGPKSMSLSVDAGGAAAAGGVDNDICDRAFADGPRAAGRAAGAARTYGADPWSA